MKTNKLILTAMIVSCVGSTAMAATTNIDNSVGGNAGNYNAEHSLFIGRDHTINVAEAGFKPAQNVAMLGDDNHIHPDAQSVLVTGHNSNVMASYTVTSGMHNTIHKEATYALTAGWQNSNNGEASLVVGHTNAVWRAKNTLMFGENNKIKEGADNSFVGGESSIVEGKNSFAFGNGAQAKLDNTYAIGAGAITEAENTVAIGNGAVANRANTVSVGSKGNERVITNVAPGEISVTSTDAVNGSQLNTVVAEVNINKINIAANKTAIDTLANTVINNTDVLDNRINANQKEARKGIASATALAALHPLDYNPDHKVDIMGGVGHYRGNTAVALGVAYRPNENTMFTVGASINGKDTAINAGLSYKVGAKDLKYRSTASMAKDIDDLKAIVNQLVQENKALKNQKK